ncbi:amidohydrolase family protein [Arthrobacter rhombi]|uniref:amidohydrolase family protein n=1 Tax=Arthrobacter rhombi TaxID=71253 RepID=UPI003FD36D74
MPRWRREVNSLAELPQTVAKVSGLFVPGLPYTSDALRQMWEEALEAFGPERLMFDGDWPISRLGGS